MRVAMDAAGVLRIRQQLVTVAEEFTDRPTDLVESVMAVLTGMGMVDAPFDGPPLLSTQGAALCFMVRHRGATLREFSAVSGWSEGYVFKVMSGLVADGLATRTRVGQRVVYTLAQNEVLKHPDIRAIADLLIALASDIEVEVL